MQEKRRRWLLRTFVGLAVGIGVLWMLGARRPDDLGVKDGRLAPCPDKPNCVSTQATDAEHHIDPLGFETSPAEIKLAAKTLIDAMPRTKIVTETDDYIHAESRSLLCRFVDDLEIWVDSKAKLVHARSASRAGYSDLGVNRQRVEGLFQQLNESIK